MKNHCFYEWTYGWGWGEESLLALETVLHICLKITCVSVCLILHEWSWRSSPDRERNAGFTLQPFFALGQNANDVNEKVCGSPPTSHRLAGRPSSLAPYSKKGDSWATWAPKHMTSITTIQAGVKLSANRMVAALSFSLFLFSPNCRCHTILLLMHQDQG